ncbi:nickel/cobalt transporter [Aliishimia ponticola]|uniref:nickel/cobalt transporter n=1 Tax=Aliishimia ponticola TaxID=2499833 RepID=UPI001FE5EBC9|nr:hypothetical protein [Aliishimia ponticola]
MLLLVCGLAVWLWGFGGATQVSIWAAAEQREVQRGLAGALRAVRAGQPWALASLLGLCFAYGFFHAAGPGHGKLVMGGYALGTDVPRARLIGLTLAGSLGQAVTAILLVSAGALVLGWSRERMTDLADGSLEAVSAGAIVLVGLWLVWRGLRRLRSVFAERRHEAEHMHSASCSHSHGHTHGHTYGHDHADGHDHAHGNDDGVCSSCGHVHGPTAAQVAGATTWRAGLGVVLAIAVRPCTGALFVLILTFAMGIGWAGILGALVMGLGTALLTVAVALGAGELRGGFLARLDGLAGRRIMALIEIAAGLIVALVAAQTVLRVGALW